MTDKVKKRVLIACKAILMILAVNFMLRFFIDPEYTKYGGWIAGLLLPFLPEVTSLVFKRKISFRIQIFYYSFIFVALDLGICWDLYRIWLGFDKLVHFMSGIATAIVGYYTVVYFKADHTPRVFRWMFIMALSISIAVLWEFFEFACDKFLGQHMQELVVPGIADTMYDLLAATLGSILGGMIFALPGYRKFLEK